MKYDFESHIERHGMDALAVDPRVDSVYRKDIQVKDGLDPIPMWVADMNFATCPTVVEAMARRVQHPCFGYYIPRDEYYTSIVRWQKTRNHAKGLKPEHIGYENGVLGGVVSVLRAVCSQGDQVLVHRPTYCGFTGVLTNNGFNAVHTDLVRDKDGIWRMNFEEMETLLKERNIHAAIFCSPHNPTGRVWERWEIEKAMELYKKYDVYVVSDEIWSDLILSGYEHIPTQSVSADARKRTAALYAPSKTFNIAGLVGSYHIIYDKWLRDRVLKQSSLCHYNDMNVLSMYALIGAYQKEGYEWTDELCQVLTRNAEFACDYILENFPGVTLSRPQGTYLLYLDCREYLEKHGMTLDELLKKGYECGVDWQDGRLFLVEGTIRMNLALPTARVEEAFRRLKKYVFT